MLVPRGRVIKRNKFLILKFNNANLENAERDYKDHRINYSGKTNYSGELFR